MRLVKYIVAVDWIFSKKDWNTISPQNPRTCGFYAGSIIAARPIRL